MTKIINRIEHDQYLLNNLKIFLYGYHPALFKISIPFRLDR